MKDELTDHVVHETEENWELKEIDYKANLKVYHDKYMK